MNINRVTVNRLLKLATFLDTLPKQKFDFGQIVYVGKKSMLEALKAGPERCGTVGCAMGWMPAVFPKQITWDGGPKGAHNICFRTPRRGRGCFEVAQEFFGITLEEAHYLFNPGGSSERDNYIGERAGPQTVAKHIRRFVAHEIKLLEMGKK